MIVLTEFLKDTISSYFNGVYKIEHRNLSANITNSHTDNVLIVLIN